MGVTCMKAKLFWRKCIVLLKESTDLWSNNAFKYFRKWGELTDRLKINRIVMIVCRFGNRTDNWFLSRFRKLTEFYRICNFSKIKNKIKKKLFETMIKNIVVLRGFTILNFLNIVVYYNRLNRREELMGSKEKITSSIMDSIVMSFTGEEERLMQHILLHCYSKY